jgi:putative membrane-bound dehydrogenase-like protein
MKHLLSLLLLTTALHAEPISLFDGKSLDGWDYDPKIWRVEDGMITGGSTTEKIKENHFICSKKSYQNFDLKLKIKVSGDPKTGMLNSGIQIRSLRVPGGAHMTGYQVDCGAGWFGKIYDEFRRNKVIWAPTPEQQSALDKAIDVFGWNEYRIRAEGARIQTWINGVLCIDYTETDKNIALDGLIGPQVHSGGVCLVQVKDVTIEELAPTPGAPTWESLGGVDAARKLVAPPPKPQADARAAPKRDISYNNVQGTALTAEEQLKKFHVPEGYEIELVVKESEGLGKFVSVYFDQRGRMWTQTALEYPVDANENPAAAEAVYAAHGKDKVLVYPRESVNGPIPADGLTNPTVFADGLAIPTGMLPWGNGDTCYVQHGHDLKLYKDTNGDGKADTFDVILTGFGVQDSHLFPHQFTRAPGGWIWMAQGLFNNSKVHKPGSDVVVEYPKCGMARFRPDGSDFEMTSVGPNNIWGLVITGEGETFIQEANDYGYSIMPFHEYAYYPGGMEALKKGYQPDFPPQAEFRMGGTGLSGLALIESGTLRDPKAAHTMAVANPITSKIQTLGMHRDGAYWKLEQLADLITCDDPFFRPVGLTNGPDGYIYIIDWYNKIISHNEVSRAHPDRDKTRGRIWRVKPKGAKTEVADFTKLSSEELNAALKDGPVGKTQIAWQTLSDRKELGTNHWAASEYAYPRESIQIRALGRNLSNQNIGELLSFAKPSLPGPTTQSSRGPKQIPVREAYDREFERFLVRMFLERHPDVVAKFLDSEAAAKLPVEARVLASLALEPKSSASRVAKLLPQLDRAPNDEELLRLAQFPAEAGVGVALKALLTNEKSRTVVAEKLLTQRTKLDAKQIAPLLTETAKGMIGSNEGSVRNLALQLIGGFQLVDLEDSLVQPLKMAIAVSGGDLRMVVDSKGTNSSDPKDFVATLQVLKDLRSGAADVFVSLATIGKPQVRDAAVEALAASRAPDAAAKLLTLYPSLQPAQRRAALNTLASTKAGAQTIVAALLDKTLPQADLDGPTVERLATVLGNDPALEKLQQQLGGIFREVLLLDGEDTAWVDSKITLAGPFTIEAWVRLAEGISNADSLFGSPGGVDMNFFGSKFRVYAGSELKDVCVATKPMTPDLWTHLAVTRDEKGIIRIYQNGELDATGSKPAPARWENCRIGWSGPKQGTEGVITEFRVWPNARTPAEIRTNFDRVLPPQSKQNYKPLEPIDPEHPGQGALKFGTGPNPYGKGARLAKTIDTPPLLTEEQAKALDTKFARYTALAPKGNAANGKVLSALCMACHQIGSAGGQIGPNLSGAGAMGLEAVLRNILTPNAAMEPGYRIYRVEMKNGDLIDAFFVSEDKNATIIRQPGLQDRRLDKKDIRSTKFIRRSLMPEGLLDTLQDQQVADLLAYLMTLKG